MISKKLKSVLAGALLVSSLVSCKKEFGDTNIDSRQPSPTALKTRFLLTSALQQVHPTVFGNTTGNYYVQYVSEGPYPGGSLYTGKNFTWDGTYTGPLYDLERIIQLNESGAPEADASNGATANQLAVANILQSYFFMTMTDRWGDIPYIDALKGVENLGPSYTSQKVIYDSLFAVLTRSVSQIDEAGFGVQGDLLLGGDMLWWKKFANTMRMDMALRLSVKDPVKGKAEFVAALNASGGPIQSNAENIEWNYIDDPNYLNPWYSNYTISNRNDYAISKTMTDYMLPKGDNRITVYAEQLAGAEPYKGLPYGSSTAKNIPNAYSRIGDAFRTKIAPARIYNYAQVLFMVAEANKIGYLPGGDAAAAIAYQEAIKASWEMNGVYDAADFTAYMAQVVYNPATAVQQIITEKWIHNYLNGYAAWNDWRRTGFPVLTPAVDAADSRGIPVRQGYPVSEQTQNKDSYTAAVTAQGADHNYTKIWWDN
jgi:hypothetical protein